MINNRHISFKASYPLLFLLALFFVGPVISEAAPPSPGAVRSNLPKSGGLTLPQDIPMEELIVTEEEESAKEETEKSDDPAQAPSKDETAGDQAPALSPVEE